MTEEVKQVEINEVAQQPQGEPLFKHGLDSLISGLEIEVHAKLGKASVAVKDLKELQKGSIVSLDTELDSELSLYFQEHLIAKGKLVAVDDSYALEITHTAIR